MFRRAVAATLLGASLLSIALVACNAIIGVQDVGPKKSKDRSLGDDEGPEGENTPDPNTGDGNIENRPNVFQAALGESHTCARKPDGTVKCWGADDLGQTGSGGTKADAGIVATPVDVTGITDAVDIAAGRNHTCVAKKGGNISCWGNNPAGQLGNGEANNSKSTPVDVTSIKGLAVAAGGDFSCAIRLAGTVACWGGNDNGQLGRGDQIGSTVGVAVRDITNVVSISAGQAHACAVKVDGQVFCWGDGQNGQLGWGQVGSKSAPVAVESLPAASMVACGQRSTCALTRTGSVSCWGANELGQLGTGAPNNTANPSPTIVANLNDVTSIRAGRDHTCAVKKDGRVVCWGSGAKGQLGDGQVRGDGGAGAQASAVTVSGVQTAVSVGTGGEHSCVPTMTNSILCWGANGRGQLGNGTTKNEVSPAPVSGYP